MNLCKKSVSSLERLNIYRTNIMGLEFWFTLCKLRLIYEFFYFSFQQNLCHWAVAQDLKVKGHIYGISSHRVVLCINCSPSPPMARGESATIESKKGKFHPSISYITQLLTGYEGNILVYCLRSKRRAAFL